LDLLEGTLRVEVMEGVPDHDGIGWTVGERDGLGRAVQHTYTRQTLLDHRAHVPGGLDRNELQAEEHQPLRELPSARREIYDERCLVQATSLHYPGDGLGRVVRAEGVVRIGIDQLEAEPGSHGHRMVAIRAYPLATVGSDQVWDIKVQEGS
jgi:hypothetical protein